MDRIAFKWTILGALAGLALDAILWAEMRAFGVSTVNPSLDLWGRVQISLLPIGLGACIGWACGVGRSRPCPQCGAPMGTVNIPGGESNDAQAFYACRACGATFTWSDILDRERHTKPPPDPDAPG